jgi:hypothetical protein
MQCNAGVGRKRKRSRVVAEKFSSTGITIVPKVDAQGYPFHLVQGWKEEGRWQRRRFKDQQKAESFAATLRVDMENKGRSQRMVLSALAEEQHEEALRAFDQLGGIYTLTETVDFFLRHHRSPDFTIHLVDAIKLYIDDRERDGLRPKTIKGLSWSLGLFNSVLDNPYVHEVMPGEVASFLQGLRARNGRDRATRRSWEIHRGALHGFFVWCTTQDAGSNRPFTFTNPVEGVRKFSARQVREEQSAKPGTTSPDDVRRMFGVLMRWRGGVLVRPYAMLYFAGIRPEEMKRLAGRESELVNMKTLTITIPANVSKTRHERQVRITKNLAAWLRAYPGDLTPINFESLNKRVRKHFQLSHDEARHSFISYHVAVQRSVGDVALQAGNSESIVRRHYLNLHPAEEGKTFFGIVPDLKSRRAVIDSKSMPKARNILRAI